MLESLSYSVTGAMSDRSRYSVSYSASKWSPDAQDLRIDDAIASFAKLGFVKPSTFFVDSISHHPISAPQIDETPGWNAGAFRRPQQPSYIDPHIEPQSDYESIFSSHGTSHRPSLKAIEYHCPSTGRHESVINVGRASQCSLHHGAPKSYILRHSSSSRSSRQRALVPYDPNYAIEEEEDDDDDLAPSDSISQISTSRHQYHHYAPKEERRGRTMRRENRPIHKLPSVVSGTTVRHGGAGGGVSGAGYQTRILTPFD